MEVIAIRYWKKSTQRHEHNGRNIETVENKTLFQTVFKISDIILIIIVNSNDEVNVHDDFVAYHGDFLPPSPT